MIKKFSFLVFVIFAFAKIQAQGYLISFAGSGETSTVETVEVQNLTQGTSLTLDGSDVLQLDEVVNVSELDKSLSSPLRIYPNPAHENVTVEFDVQYSGVVFIELIDLSGRQIVTNQVDLRAGKHTFKLKNLSAGIYTVSLRTDRNSYSAKIVSNNAATGSAGLEYVGGTEVAEKKTEKSQKATIQMQYNEGDLLLFTAFSGDFITVSTLVPTENSTVTSNFVSATDADGNNYATVTIGDQIWMAENLRVTTYPDGTAIPHVSDNTAWANLDNNNTDDAYCWYNNDEATNADTYGALYTYAAAIGDDWTHQNTTGQGVCPDGWHLPSDTEWTELTDYLGGLSIAGGKLKDAGTTNWSSPNYGATNESGFSAPPGGRRSNYSGEFTDAGDYGYWWSATEYSGSGSYIWIRGLFYATADVAYTEGARSDGFSIRCVRD